MQWRYGSVGLFSGFLLTPLLAVLIAGAVSTFAEHRRVSRVLAILNIVVAVLLILAMAAFALDAFQMRHTVPDVKEARWTFDVAAIKATAKYLLAAAVLFWLAKAELGAAKLMPVEKKSRREEAHASLALGKPPAEAKPPKSEPTS